MRFITRFLFFKLFEIFLLVSSLCEPFCLFVYVAAQDELQNLFILFSNGIFFPQVGQYFGFFHILT